MNNQIRTFIAIDIPSEIKQAIAHVQNELRPIHGANVSFPRMEGIHLTLKFLGDVEREQLDQVTEAVRGASTGINRFELITTGVGGFPNLKDPRVLWWGLKDSKPLLQLHKQIDSNLAQIGFPIERKRFNAHLTVGRVKYISKDSELIDKFEQCDLSPVSWTVNEVNVMSSQLRPSGAVYSVIASVPL